MSLQTDKKIPSKSHLPHRHTDAQELCNAFTELVFQCKANLLCSSFTVKRTAEALSYTRNSHHLPLQQNHRTEQGLGPSNSILKASFHPAQAACTCPHLTLGTARELVALGGKSRLPRLLCCGVGWMPACAPAVRNTRWGIRNILQRVMKLLWGSFP